jgi:hypothetical protein
MIKVFFIIDKVIRIMMIILFGQPHVGNSTT